MRSASGWVRRSSPGPGRPTRSSRRSPTTTVRRLGDVPALVTGNDVGAAGPTAARAPGLAPTGRPTKASRPGSRSTSSRSRSAGRDADDRAGRDEPAVATQHQEGGEVRRRGHPGQRRPTCRRSTRCTSRPPQRDHFTPRPLGVLPADVRRHARPRIPTGSGSTSPITRATWSPRRPGSGSARIRWYSYGASSTAKRDVRGSNAVQWQMIRDAIGCGRRGLRPPRHHRHARSPTTRTSG